MNLRHISMKCPLCGRVWGRTEEYSHEHQFEESEEVEEYRYCISCRNRKKGKLSVKKGKSE